MYYCICIIRLMDNWTNLNMRHDTFLVLGGYPKKRDVSAGRNCKGTNNRLSAISGHPIFTIIICAAI